MIDLNISMQDLCADIQASDALPHTQLTDLSDPAFAELDEITLRVHARRRREVLTPLQEAFARRFSDVPPSALDRDLLYLLKKGLGNAFKHGNRDDPSRAVEVEIVTTRQGAVVAIRDQGPGFDVESAVQGFRRDRRYFHNKGSGFRNFEKARSRVSWADGGRTLLLGFRCDPPDEISAAESAQSALGSLADNEHVLSLAKESIAQFRDGKWSAVSCSVNLLNAAEPVEFACAVQYLKGGSSKPREKTWTGRVLPEREARADTLDARQLKGDPLGGRGGLIVPRASKVSDRHPGLVFHKVHADMDLTDYLDGVVDAEKRDALVKVALGLRDLHGSEIELESSEERETALAEIRERLDHVETRLGETSAASIASLRGLLAEPPSLAEWQDVPIHGQMGWDCVLFDDGRFFLWRFEKARRGHPGFDLGGVLADLLLSPFAVELARSLTETYFVDSRTSWCRVLPFFTAAGVLERLDRMLERGDAPPDLASTLDRVGELAAIL